MSETVEHPSYYYANGIECIDVMRQIYGMQAVYDFCLCNALKYLWRVKGKHSDPLPDLKKSAWYLDYIIKNKEMEEQNND